MSGNDERLTIEVSRELFSLSCPKCNNTSGYDFIHGRWSGGGVRVLWTRYSDDWYVRQDDRRMTRKSFVNKEVRCVSCWEPVVDPKLRAYLIDMVNKRLTFWNERW